MISDKPTATRIAVVRNKPLLDLVCIDNVFIIPMNRLHGSHLY